MESKKQYVWSTTAAGDVPKASVQELLQAQLGDTNGTGKDVERK